MDAIGTPINDDTSARELVPREPIEDIVRRRDEALRHYSTAYEALTKAGDAIKVAASAGQAACSNITSYNHFSRDERKDFLATLNVADEEDYHANARRLTDIDVWSSIIQMTDLERLMDKKAKDELRGQLQDDPPEITVENIAATLRQFLLSADDIFRRGIAECFSNLDRRFRSHDGWKMGSRIILSCAFGDSGMWNFYGNQRDSIIDVERTFRVLDGDELTMHHCYLVAAIEEARRGHYGARQTEVETEYFLVRIYKNGNCHIWFKRDDLLTEVNKLLGEYYDAAIPEDREPEDDGDLFKPKTTLAKNYGFFPTPDDLADTIIGYAGLYRDKDEPQLTVLEPSAGTGKLAGRAVEKGAITDCVEIKTDFAEILARSGLFNRVFCSDFLKLSPMPERLYDRIIMNPPFDRERDIDHVVHALKFLKPDGCLVSIMSAGTEFRETRKSKAFRAMVDSHKGKWRDLPARSFSEVGTNINTIVLRIWKDGRTQWW